MMPAPIVLFVFKRPQHTQQQLDSLAANAEAKDSLLYIFADGAKTNADKKELEQIAATRKIIRAEKRFKQIIITEQDQNKGLANSIMDGVTQVVNAHGTVIVLED